MAEVSYHLVENIFFFTYHQLLCILNEQLSLESKQLKNTLVCIFSFLFRVFFHHRSIWYIHTRSILLLHCLFPHPSMWSKPLTVFKKVHINGTCLSYSTFFIFQPLKAPLHFMSYFIHSHTFKHWWQAPSAHQDELTVTYIHKDAYERECKVKRLAKGHFSSY